MIMMNKTKSILGKFFSVFVVPKGVYEYKTANTTFESIKKDWEDMIDSKKNNK